MEVLKIYLEVVGLEKRMNGGIEKFYDV
jgi:hypothetical protein